MDKKMNRNSDHLTQVAAALAVMGSMLAGLPMLEDSLFALSPVLGWASRVLLVSLTIAVGVLFGFVISKARNPEATAA